MVEVNGIGWGKSFYPRRVFSHYIAFESLINQVADNAEAIVREVAAERETIRANGGTGLQQRQRDLYRSQGITKA